jgi:hypothetical protein
MTAYDPTCANAFRVIGLSPCFGPLRERLLTGQAADAVLNFHLLEAKSWALGNAFQEPETRECSPPSQDTSTKKSGFSLRGTDGGRLRAVTYQGRRED